MKILIIGGTRNLGHALTLELLNAGHDVTALNRGKTPDELPPEVTRLRGDREDYSQLKHLLAGKSFDATIDTTLYKGSDAEAIVKLLAGRVGHYIFISTGQVYLVRPGLKRPFVETDYAGPIMDAPPVETRDYEDWLYGAAKREAEDVFQQAWESQQFPITSLRLPMVNSERDHYHRIYGYLLRLKDGGPILIPAGEHLRLRHVYGQDVVKAIAGLIRTGAGKGSAYNLSQDETLSIDDFLALLAGLSGHQLRTIRVERDLLEARKLLPFCSPFSGEWMSELDNRKSKTELGLEYTPLPVYLRKLVEHYNANPQRTPVGYLQRAEELELNQTKKEWDS